MKINSITQNYLTYRTADKSNPSFKSAMSKKVKKALTSEDDFILKQYYEEIKDIKPLSRKEEKALALQIQKGGEEADAAREKLITAALPYIVYYSTTFQNNGMALADVIQEGNMTVTRLINETPYDGRKSLNNFIYRTLFRRVNQAISEKSSTIRLPLFVYENVQKVQKAQKILEKRLLRTPSDEEIAKETGLSVWEVKVLKRQSRPVEYLNRRTRRKADIEDIRTRGRHEHEAGKKIDIEQFRADIIRHFTKKGVDPVSVAIFLERFGFNGENEEPSFQKLGEKHLGRDDKKEIARQRVWKCIKSLCKSKKMLEQDGYRDMLEYDNLFE